MSTNEPSITASDITSYVENLLGNPNLSLTHYLPWVSFAYQRTYQAIIDAGQTAKEEIFGTSTTFNLTAGTGEYSISTNLPRFGGFIKVEIRYGKSGDDWIRATKLPSQSFWRIDANNTTSYRGKDAALYYKRGDNLGFIPIPPADESDQTPVAKVFFVQRPYQLTDGADVVDIPYRFLTPLYNYVQAKAIEKENEDYGQSREIMARFEFELEQLTSAVQAEFDENDGSNEIQVSADSPILSNPLNF